MAPMLLPLSIGMSLLSAGIGAAGTIAAGQNAKAMGDYQAQQYLEQSKNDVASGQRSQEETERQTRLVQSTLQARAAGSGVDATSPSVLSVSKNIATQGEYSALMKLSAGQDQAAGLENQAMAAQYGGKIAQQGDNMQAIGTIASGVGSAVSGYRIGTSPYSGYGGYGGYGYGAAPAAPTSYDLG